MLGTFQAPEAISAKKVAECKRGISESMVDIGIGAVATAIIAGLISLLGLVIGKEQKVSEFRQAWIDELRKCLVSYLVNINAIADAIRVAQSERRNPTGLESNYKALNEANHGIRLRVNDTEQPSIDLLEAMNEFERLASKNAQLTPDNIRSAESKFLLTSKVLLKFEWKRVKRGEKTYFWTKYIVIALIIVMFLILVALWWNRDTTQTNLPSVKNAEKNLSAVGERARAAPPEILPPPNDQKVPHPETVGQKVTAPENSLTQTCSTPAEQEATCLTKGECPLNPEALTP